MKIGVKLADEFIHPRYATTGSAGADLHAYLPKTKSVVIQPGDRELISTGLTVELPEGYEMQVRPRSGLAIKHGVTVLNSPGTIDSDYRGTVGVILINHGKEPFTVNHGDRIAQAVIAPVAQADEFELELVKERGAGGFGSTGKDSANG